MCSFWAEMGKFYILRTAFKKSIKKQIYFIFSQLYTILFIRAFVRFNYKQNLQIFKKQCLTI